MKVLILSSLLPARGLTDRPPDVWLTTKALQGHCESMLVGPVPWAPRLPLPGRWRRYTTIPQHEVVEGLAIHHPRYVIVPKTARWVQGRSYERQLERVLAGIRPLFVPDVIFATWAYPDAYAAVHVGARLGIPVVAKVVGSDVNLLPHQGAGREVAFAMRNADRVVGICADLCTKAVELGAQPQNCVVIKNGLDLDRFVLRERHVCRAELAVPADSELMLFVGNLKEVKGPDLLIAAFARLAPQRPLARLVVIGDGPLLHSLQGQARASGVADRVAFLGRRSHAELATWMNAANLLVLPSRSEGLPNVITEALACGTPVLATRVGGVAEAFDAGVAGRLVAPEDSVALAEGIGAALDTPFSRLAVRASLRARPWSAVAGDLVLLFEEVVRQRQKAKPAAGDVGR